MGVNVGAVEGAGNDVFFSQVGRFHGSAFVSSGMVIGHKAFGHFLNVVFVGRPALFVPADDGGTFEEKSLAALDVRDKAIGHLSVDGLHGGLFGKEGGQLLNGHFVVRVEVAGLEGPQGVPGETDDGVGRREHGRDVLFRHGLEIVELFFELLFKGLGRLGGQEGGLVKDQVGRFSFGHSLVCCASALPVRWRLGRQKSQRRLFRWQR